MCTTEERKKQAKKKTEQIYLYKRAQHRRTWCKPEQKYTMQNGTYFFAPRFICISVKVTGSNGRIAYGPCGVVAFNDTTNVVYYKCAYYSHKHHNTCCE